MSSELKFVRVQKGLGVKGIKFQSTRFNMDSTPQSIGFGGGCHWCTEAVFQSLRGVHRVQSGWITSEGSHSSESEAVLIEYDPRAIPLDVLIEIHVLTHSSYSEHSMREKYRSAIYVFSTEQATEAQQVLRNLTTKLYGAPITMTLPFVSFREVSAAYQSYYYTDPSRPFCTSFIEPKLRKVIDTHKDYIS